MLAGAPAQSAKEAGQMRGFLGVALRLMFQLPGNAVGKMLIHGDVPFPGG